MRGIALAGGLIAIVLVAYTLRTQGVPQAALLLLGVGLGFALFHARFGFTSAWRQLVAVGQGKALRAHTLLLAATAILFAPFLAAGVSPTGVEVAGYVAPVGVGVVVGATVGAAHMGWWEATPSMGPASLTDLFGGTVGGLAITLVVLGLIAAATLLVGRRRNPPPVEPVATTTGLARVVRGSWPLWVGALALAVLNLGGSRSLGLLVRPSG